MTLPRGGGGGRVTAAGAAKQIGRWHVKRMCTRDVRMNERAVSSGYLATSFISILLAPINGGTVRIDINDINLRV